MFKYLLRDRMKTLELQGVSGIIMRSHFFPHGLVLMQSTNGVK